MFFGLVLFAVSLVSSNSFADASWILNDPQLLIEAKALTKTTKRNLTVYHWTGRNNVAGLPAGSLTSKDAVAYEAVQQNMLDRMNRFWETSTPVSGRSYGGGAMAPNGLYFASNPVISRSYGGVNWMMYQAVMPKDMIFIDGRYRSSPAVGPNLAKVLESRGCTNPTPNETLVFSARSLIKADTHQVACRQALIDIAEATETKAIFYIFKEEPMAICNEINPWNIAMVVISPDAFIPFSLEFFTKDLSAEDDGLNFLRSLHNAMFKNAKQEALYPSLPSASEEDMATYANENLMACNPAVREW